MKGYDTALICPNGHFANRYKNSYPEQNTKHCSQCGEENISDCPACKKPIRGAYLGHALNSDHSPPPAFCPHCGKAFPWTERKK
ncbi:DUF2321 domain-containing protein [bacterium]|nr:DUF2321 domain-containing protein [bacterium]